MPTILSEATRRAIRKDAERNLLTRQEAADKWGIPEWTARRIMKGLPAVTTGEHRRQTNRGATKALLSDDDARKIVALKQDGQRWAEISECFRVSVSAAKTAANRILGTTGRVEPKTAPKMGFTRVRFAGGGTLTVSHGEGEEYARSMVEAMTAGRSVASVEVANG